MFKRYCKIIFYTIICLIAACYTFCSFYMPYVGDDIGFLVNYPLDDHWYAWLRGVFYHWLRSNGRLSDMLTPPVVTAMPMWLRALTNGLSTALMFFIIARFATRNSSDSYFRASILCFLLCFTLRWDSVWMEFCASIVYVWAAAFTLCALYIALHAKRNLNLWLRLFLFALCFLGASMHEAAGVPLACGLMLYLLICHKNSGSHIDPLLAAGFIAGAFFTLTSPAQYQRVGSMMQPEPVGIILLNSDAWFLILILVVAAMLLFARKRLSILAKSQWLIFSTAAAVSTLFLIVARYGGRPGWFAQIYALIALFGILPSSLKLLNDKAEFIISLIVPALIGAHLYLVACWQQRLGSETRQAISLFRESPEGVFFFDYTPDSALPLYLLRKNHGVPDADDTYYLSRLSSYYGDGKPFVMLPTAFKSTDWKHFSGTRTVADHILSSARLEGTRGDTIFPEFPRVMLDMNGKELIETKFSKEGREFFLYTPADRDPGEK